MADKKLDEVAFASVYTTLALGFLCDSCLFEAGESISEVPSIIRAILLSFLIKWARPSPLKRAGEGREENGPRL